MSTRQLSPEEADRLWAQAVDLRNNKNTSKHLEQQNKRKAIDLAKQLIKEGPVTPYVLSMLNCFIADIYHLDLNEPDTSIDYYRETLSHDPEKSRAWEMLGVVYLKHKKDYEAAVSALQKALNHCESPATRLFIEDELAEARDGLDKMNR